MAKSREGSLIDELKKREAELEEMRTQVREDLEAQLESILAQFDELKISLPDSILSRVRSKMPMTPKPAEKGDKNGTSGKARQQRSCSICRAAGLVEESKGHIARTHDRWLEKQSPEIKAHFKGSLGNGEQKLVQ